METVRSIFRNWTIFEFGFTGALFENGLQGIRGEKDSDGEGLSGDICFSSRLRGSHHHHRVPLWRSGFFLEDEKWMDEWDSIFRSGIICGSGGFDVFSEIVLFNFSLAVERRAIRVDLPDVSQRKKILETILKETSVSTSLDVEAVASRAKGFSGSDLRELCRCALMIPMKEKIRNERKTKKSVGLEPTLRGLTTSDFLLALETVRPTTEASEEYREHMNDQRRSDGGAFTTNLDNPRSDSDFLRSMILGALASSANTQTAEAMDKHKE